jgi:hypothetical protein
MTPGFSVKQFNRGKWPMTSNDSPEKPSPTPSASSPGQTISEVFSEIVTGVQSMFARGPSWTVADIAKQFDYAKDQGWLVHFRDAAASINVDQAILMAIASRETNIKSIQGDGGHGHGIMQIDDRSYPEFCQSDDWKDPRKNIFKGAEVLEAKRKQILDAIGKDVVCKSRQYRAVTLTDLGLLRTSIAAYNSGCQGHYNISTNGNPDTSTTGSDYSCDVINRAEAFTRLLSAAVA